MTIVQRTEILTEGVVYTVRVDDVEVWRREVAFGFTEAHRAGGPAFQMAARQQADVAQGYAQRAAHES